MGRRRRRLRDRRRLRRSRGGSGRRPGAAAGAGRGPRRHLEHVRRALLPRRGYGGAAGHRPRRHRGLDVRLPRRRLPRTGARQDPGVLRRVGRALRLAGGARVRVRALLLPRQGGHPARHRGADVHRQREGLAVRRAGDAGPARTQGSRPGRHRGHQAGHGPAAFARGRSGRRGSLRDRRDQPRGRRLRRRRGSGLAAVPGDRAGPRRLGRARGGRVRDERRHGRRAHAGPRVEAVHPRVDVRRRAGDPPRRVGRRGAQAHGPAVHHRAVLPALDSWSRD